MKTRLKSCTSKEFPRDFWNYFICPITGFKTGEKSDEDKIARKYYTQEQVISQ